MQSKFIERLQLIVDTGLLVDREVHVRQV